MNWMGNGGEFEIKETYFLRWESLNIFDVRNDSVEENWCKKKGNKK